MVFKSFKSLKLGFIKFRTIQITNFKLLEFFDRNLSTNSADQTTTMETWMQISGLTLNIRGLMLKQKVY